MTAVIAAAKLGAGWTVCADITPARLARKFMKCPCALHSVSSGGRRLRAASREIRRTQRRASLQCNVWLRPTKASLHDRVHAPLATNCPMSSSPDIIHSLSSHPGHGRLGMAWLGACLFSANQSRSKYITLRRGYRAGAPEPGPTNVAFQIGMDRIHGCTNSM